MREVSAKGYHDELPFFNDVMEFSIDIQGGESRDPHENFSTPNARPFPHTDPRTKIGGTITPPNAFSHIDIFYTGCPIIFDTPLFF